MNNQDNKKYGYIKLFRSMKEWEWFTDPKTAHFYIYCMLSVNNTDKKLKGQLIKKGSFVTSLEKISHETGLSIQNIRTAIRKLESTGEITYTSSRKGSIITINNYSYYQSSTDRQHIANNHSTTNKNSKNKKNNTTADSGISVPECSGSDKNTNQEALQNKQLTEKQQHQLEYLKKKGVIKNG